MPEWIWLPRNSPYLADNSIEKATGETNPNSVAIAGCGVYWAGDAPAQQTAADNTIHFFILLPAKTIFTIFILLIALILVRVFRYRYS